MGCLISGGFVFFLIISHVGQKLLANIESKMHEQSADTEMNHTHTESRDQESDPEINQTAFPQYSGVIA